MECLKKITILYAEDEQMVREGYARTLKRYSKELYVAQNGEEAFEKYRLYKPDIVISDIRMPKMNGIELTKKIKEINPKQIILFTTAHTESNYTLEALDMQVDGYITKPVDKNRLLNKLETLAGYIISERENKEHQEILQNMFENSKLIQVLTNLETIKFATPSFFELLQVKDKKEFEEKFGSILTIFEYCESSKECLYIKDSKEFIEKIKNSSEESITVAIKGLKDRFFYISLKSISDKQSGLYFICMTDISELQREKREALYKASHDSLTRLYNREKFDELYTLSFKQVQRYDRKFSLAIADIDFFKKINDTYGHIFGDEVLQKIAKCLKSSLRKTDILARWGGEEFALIMVETDLEQAKKVCEEIRKEVEQIKFENSCRVTISIGIATLQKEDTKETLFKRADEALYEAKRSGRNKVLTK